MSWQFLLLICIVVDVVLGIDPMEYCSHNCSSENPHTVCIYMKPAEGCQDISGGIGGLVRNFLLNSHNQLRDQVASGSVEGLPKSSNMQVMYWDSELELISQKWASQCRTAGDHDTCRPTLDGTPTGQNMYRGKQSNESLQDAMQAWNAMKEKGSFAWPEGGKYVEQTSTDIYTQLIWADTRKFGCGIGYEAKAGGDFIMVCDYRPKGNVVDKVIYKEGAPCSACGAAGACDQNYNNLCGIKEIRRSTPSDEGGNDSVQITTDALVHSLLVLSCMVLLIV